MIDKLPPGNWHFIGGYNAVQVGDIKKIRKENEMPEISCPELNEFGRPKIVCGICGKSTPYSADGKDIIFIHKCEPDREYLETMKRIAFKLLGIEDPVVSQPQTMQPYPGMLEFDLKKEFAAIQKDQKGKK
jgi:hypothetical protein